MRPSCKDLASTDFYLFGTKTHGLLCICYFDLNKSVHVIVHVITVVVRTVVILVCPGVHDVISHVDITEVTVVVIFVSDKFSSKSLLLAEFT